MHDSKRKENAAFILCLFITNYKWNRKANLHTLFTVSRYNRKQSSWPMTLCNHTRTNWHFTSTQINKWTKNIFHSICCSLLDIERCLKTVMQCINVKQNSLARLRRFDTSLHSISTWCAYRQNCQLFKLAAELLDKLQKVIKSLFNHQSMLCRIAMLK